MKFISFLVLVTLFMIETHKVFSTSKIRIGRRQINNVGSGFFTSAELMKIKPEKLSLVKSLVDEKMKRHKRIKGKRRQMTAVNTIVKLTEGKRLIKKFKKTLMLLKISFEKIRGLLNYKLVGKVYNHYVKNQAKILVNEKEKTIFIAFKDTNIFFIKDLSFVVNTDLLKYPFCRRCKVMKRVLMSSIILMPKIDEILKRNFGGLIELKDYKIELSGYGMGATLALLYSIHLLRRYPSLKDKVKLFAFASPRIGNLNFASYSDSIIGSKNIYRVNFNHDPLPNLPLTSQGFYHPGTEYKFGIYDFFLTKRKESLKVPFSFKQKLK